MKQDTNRQPLSGPEIMLRISTIGLLGVLCFNIWCIVASNDQPASGQVINIKKVERPFGSPDPEEPRVRSIWKQAAVPQPEVTPAIPSKSQVAHRQSEIRRVAHWGAPESSSQVNGFASPPPVNHSPLIPRTTMADFGLPPLPAPDPKDLGVTQSLQVSSAGFATGASFGLPPIPTNTKQFRQPLPTMNEALSVTPLPGMEKVTGRIANPFGTSPTAKVQNGPPRPDMAQLQLAQTQPTVTSLQELEVLPKIYGTTVDEYGLPASNCYNLRWINAEFLGWFVGDDSLPPLLTTAPDGTPAFSAGQLGQPSTQVLFGDDGRFTPGARWTMGYIPNTCTNRWQPEFEVMGLTNQGRRNFDSSDGILVRPFFNTDAAVNGPDTQILNMPGLANGTMAFSFGSQLLSAAPRLRKPLWNSAELNGESCSPHGLDANGNACRPCEFSGMKYNQVDFLGGYRYLRFSERLSALELLEPTGGGVAPGTAFELSDRIQTRNDFHGGEFGFSWLRGENCWSTEVVGLLGLGSMRSRYTLDGQTNGYIGNRLLYSNAGGFLVRPENIGRFTKNRFTFMPQLRLKLRYQWNEWLHSHIGYDFLYMRPVVRPGSVASTSFDGSTLGADPTPITTIDPNPGHDDVLLHGFNLGVTLTW